MTPDEFQNRLKERIPILPERKWWSQASLNTVVLATELYKEALEANPALIIETRDAAANAIQDVIKERTCFGIGIGVIREALDTAFPITVTPTNPAPVIETANGAVDMEPNPTPGPHHTTQRIAELNDVVSALAESNNNLMDNQGIHAAAIAELQRRVEAAERHTHTYECWHPGYPEGGEGTHEEETSAPNNTVTPDTPPQPTTTDALEFVQGMRDVIQGVFTPEAANEAWEEILGPEPPAAPDEDAKWEQVERTFTNSKIAAMEDDRQTFGVAQALAIRAAVAKAVELGLVPTPRIGVTDEDISRVLYLTSGIASPKSIARVLRAFAQHKNGADR